jgi:5S rRNA maturation endonuclease (ribonuclease M5)
MYQHTEKLLNLLDGVSSTANGWEARCPCRQDDTNPSLSVHEKADGQILVHCFRSSGACGASEIVTSVGLNLSDLRPESDTTDFDPPKPPPKTRKKAKSKLTHVETYKYLDANNELAFEKVRLIDENGKKTFRQRRPDDHGGWAYSLGDIPKILYNLPAVLAAKEANETIFIVEGEKDCDTLTRAGATATTMPGGAGKWLPIHTEAVKGMTVDLIADNDEPGYKHAYDVHQKLTEAGCDVQIWTSPTGKDITDHMDSGGTTAELHQITSAELEKPPTKAEKPLTPAPEPTKNEKTLQQLHELLANPNKTLEQKLNKVHHLTQRDETPTIRNEGRLVPWEDFLNEAGDDTYDWLIPGILERRERVMIVAAEGVGKTILARQVAICTSMGINPFTFQEMPKIKTLTIDLENPERIIRRTSRRILAAAKARKPDTKLSAHLFIKPDGLNLLKAQDRILLEQHIEEVEPELLLIGPLYKAFLDPGGKTSESVAIEIATYLDTLRSVYNVALWIEHHAPLGSSMGSRELRPFGSAVWSRWPEFGLSLQPDPTNVGDYIYDVNHFRGARDERQWPTKMKRGTRFPFEVLEFMKVN